MSQSLDLAIEKHQTGKLQEAEQLYRQVLQIEPGNAAAMHLLGVIAGQTGRYDFASECIRKALRLHPNYAEAYSNLGNVYQAQGNLDEAADSYRHAVRLNPQLADAHNNLGNILKSQRKLTDAVECMRRALEIKPNYADACYNLGNVLTEQGNFEEAIACYRQALQLRPGYAEAHHNLAIALKDRGDVEEALDCYRKAISCKPDYAEVHNDMAGLLVRLGRHQEAYASYRKALQLKIDYPEAHLGLGILLLLQGRFDWGWLEYEWRWRTKLFAGSVRSYQQPRWDGSSLEGKTILLYTEQGLGDTLQFIRYARLIRERSGTIIFECPAPLVRLVQNGPDLGQVVPQKSPLPPFDVPASLLALPGILGTDLASMPGDGPYLFADGRLVEHWRQELSQFGRLRVGIVWQGNPEHKMDRLRSVPLSRFERLARIDGVQFFSLQRGSGAEQVAELADRMPIIDLRPKLNDFMDTAAIMKNLDLVITVDTASAHLAGALGVPVWVTLPFAPDWRWLMDREDSPWYPTMRLFRQKRMGDWDEVFGRLALGIDLLAENQHTQR